VEFVVDQISHGALAAGAQTRKPNYTSLVAVKFFSLFARNGMIVPMHLNLMVGCHKRSFTWFKLSSALIACTATGSYMPQMRSRHHSADGCPVFFGVLTRNDLELKTSILEPNPLSHIPNP
jgi:hypothetical protein